MELGNEIAAAYIVRRAGPLRRFERKWYERKRIGAMAGSVVLAQAGRVVGLLQRGGIHCTLLVMTSQFHMSGVPFCLPGPPGGINRYVGSEPASVFLVKAVIRRLLDMSIRAI